MTAPRISDADLEWLAFRYAAGELRGMELDTFEQLLATDERACCAVAQAVTLGQAVVQCERWQIEHCVATVQSVKQPFPRRTVVAAACCAASLLLAVGWLSFIQSPDRQAVERSTTVAALWIQGADETPVLEPVLVVNQELADLDEEDAVPGWLLAAVNEQPQADAGDEIIMQD
ncbi:MAG: hypothetical protein V4719_03810 [Planctomycetota bacterium]